MDIAPPSTLPRQPWRWRFGRTVFDEAALLLTINGQEVDLERRPLEMLALLLAHAGEVVTKDEIVAALWADRDISDASITKCLARLRQALGDTDHQTIRTVHGFGYRFAAPVTVEAVAALPAPLAAALDFNPGDPVPQRPGWVLLRRLGTGGFGDAWLAQNRQSGQHRVAKFAQESTGLVALRRELALCRLLQEALGPRPDLIRVLDWNFASQPFFIETPWYEAGNLAEWAEAQGGIGAVPLPTRLELVAQTASALAAAHDTGVLHKDLKPANILIRPGADGAPAIVLTDFGSGRALDPSRLDAFGITRPDPGLTAVESGTSTQMYRAPELSAGGPPTVQADVFALGVLLFQMVAGDLRRPLAPGWEELVADPLLREDIARAAAGNPARRLTDAGELARLLRSLPERRTARAAAEAAAAEAARTRQALELARARRTPLLVALGVLLLGFGTSTALYFRAQRANVMAQAEAARARTVTAFLTDDLFSAANPVLAVDPNIPVTKVLGAAAADLDRRFPAASLDRAAIEAAIGGAYAGLADSGHAMPLLRASLATRNAQLGADDAQTQAVRATIADLAERVVDIKTLRMIGADILAAHPANAETELRGRFALRFADCVTVENDVVCVDKLRPLLDEMRRRLGPGHPVTLRAQNLLAQQLTMSQQFAEAIPLARQTVELTAATYGREHFLVQECRLHLGRVLLEAGHDAEAVPILEDVRRHLLAMSDGETELSARAAAQLARAYGAIGRYDEAVALLRGVVDFHLRTRGENFEFTFDTMNLLAKMLNAAGRPREAIPIGERALALSIRARGPDQEDSLWIEGNLADDYLNAGDLAHAEAIDRDVVARGEKLFTHGEWDLPRFRCLLGEILAHEGKTAEAKALLTPGVAALRAAVGADSADTRRAQTALAALGG